MKWTLNILFLLGVNPLFSQLTIDTDTTLVYDSNIKFEFERLKSNRKKKLKQGKGITIDLSHGDSTHILYGSLYKTTTDAVTIAPLWENIEIDSTNFYSRTTFEYQNSIAVIPRENIRSLKYDANYVIIPFSIGYASLFSAIVVAPLASIDQNSPNNFNSKRYVSILIPSLISTGLSLSAGFILNGGKNRFKLKPTFIGSHL